MPFRTVWSHATPSLADLIDILYSDRGRITIRRNPRPASARGLFEGPGDRGPSTSNRLTNHAPTGIRGS